MGADFLKNIMLENYTLSDKINVMMAKKKDAEIMVRPHNGNDQWTTIENPEFNWGVADYKVKPDYKLLFDKFQAAFVYDELYAAVHAQERGQNLPNIVDEITNTLSKASKELLDKVDNLIFKEDSIILTDEELKSSRLYNLVYTNLEEKYTEEAKKEYSKILRPESDFNTYYNKYYLPKLEAEILVIKSELNTKLLKKKYSDAKDTIVNGLSTILNNNILQFKSKEEADLLAKEITTKNKLKQAILGLFLEGVEQFFKDETKPVIYCKKGNLHLTIIRSKDNPKIQIAYTSYIRSDGVEEAPAIDWTLEKDKVVTVSNITTKSLEDLKNAIDSINNKQKQTSEIIKSKLENDKFDEIQIKEIQELKKEIADLKLEYNKLKDLNSILQFPKIPLSVSYGYEAIDITPKLIFKQGYLKSKDVYGINTSANLTAWKGKTVKVETRAYTKNLEGWVRTYLHNNDWTWDAKPDEYCHKSLFETKSVFFADLPLRSNARLSPHHRGNTNINYIVISGIDITTTDNTCIADFTGNNNNLIILGNSRLEESAEVGKFISLSSGALLHGIDISEKCSNLTFTQSSQTVQDWQYRICNEITSLLEVGATYTLFANFSLDSGDPAPYSTFLYYNLSIGAHNKNEVISSTATSNGFCISSITFTVADDYSLLAYNGYAGHTGASTSTYSNFKLYKHVPVKAINYANEWSHSRRIKLTGDKVDNYIYFYGTRDYCKIYDNRLEFDTDNKIFISIDREVFQDKWVHLVVTNKFENGILTKKIYINGRLYESKSNSIDGSLSNSATHYSAGQINSPNTTLSLSNLYIFDRVLSESEIYWLYQNVTYPYKNINSLGGGYYKEVVEPEFKELRELINRDFSKLKTEINNINKGLTNINEKSIIFRGYIYYTELNNITLTGFYAVQIQNGNGEVTHSGALIVIHVTGSAGILQFYKHGYSEVDQWKYRNAIDNDTRRWTPWCTINITI